jgi:hypothetical protein
MSPVGSPRRSTGPSRATPKGNSGGGCPGNRRPQARLADAPAGYGDPMNVRRNEIFQRHKPDPDVEAEGVPPEEDLSEAKMKQQIETDPDEVPSFTDPEAHTDDPDH